MKHSKFLSLVLTFSLLCSLTACSRSEDKPRIPSPTPYVTPAATASPVPTIAPTPTPFTQVDFTKLSAAPLADAEGIYQLDGLSFSPSTIFTDTDGYLFCAGYYGVDADNAWDDESGNALDENFDEALDRDSDEASDEDHDYGDSYYVDRTFRMARINLLNGEIQEFEPTLKTDEGADYTLWEANVVPFGDGFLLVCEPSNRVVYYNQNFDYLDYADIEMDLYPSVLRMNEERVVIWNYEQADYILISRTSDNQLNIKQQPFSLPDGYEISGIYAAPTQTDTTLLLTLNSYSNVLLSPDDLDDNADCIYDIVSDSAQILTYTSEDSIYLYKDKLVSLTYSDTKLSVYDRNTPNLTTTFPVDKHSLFESIFDDGSLLLYSDSEDGKTMYLKRYSLETGNLLNTVSVPVTTEFGYVGGVALLGSTLFFLTGDNLLSSRINAVNLTDDTTEPGYTAFNARRSLAEENDRLASYLTTKYNVPVFLRKDAIHYNYEYYTVVEFNETLIHEALTALERILSSFPDGFIDELYQYSTRYDSIEIYLTSSINGSPNGDNNLTQAGGFVVTSNGVKQMTVDITDIGYESTFAHEFMHIIEEVLEDKIYVTKNYDMDAFNLLEEFNPAGFNYLYSYRDYSTTKYSKYTSKYYSEPYGDDLNNIYFIDNYCLTYPSEDLARLFQNLLCSTEDTLPACFESEHIQQKAAYLCACIRAGFDCIPDDGELLPWEKLLKKTYPLEYFHENFQVTPKG